MRSFILLLRSWIARIVAFFRGEDAPVERDPDNDIVCYYGCPNSDKARRLQLEKKLYSRR